jgi:hypothetical protein
MSARSNGKLVEIDINTIEIDGGTQMRAKIDDATVSEYADVLQEGASLPPAVVFFDGTSYWLGDGFHRYHGSRKAGIGTLYCEIRKGTVRDAILYAAGANSEHGLKRTNADKRKAVEALLRDKEWSSKSDSWIASQCRVSHTFVAKLRPAVTCNVSSQRTGQDGRTINTENIGGSQNAASEPQWVETDEDREPVLSDEDWDAAEAEEAASSIPSDEKHKAILSLCTKAKKLLGELYREPAGAHLKNQQAAVHLRNFREVVSFSAPWKPCPECSGSDTGCKLCGGCGFIALGQRNVLSDQHKAKLGVA